MARHVARCGTLTIPNGGTDSPGMLSLGALGRVGLQAAVAIAISCDEAALTGAVTVEVQPFGDTDWHTLQSGGVDVAVAADKTVVISPCPFADLRLHSAAAEGAARNFQVDAQIESY